MLHARKFPTHPSSHVRLCYGSQLPASDCKLWLYWCTIPIWCPRELQIRGSEVWACPIWGAKSHLYNSQTTPSFLFQVLTQTPIPIGIDDISEKAQETWEELVVDLYNNTPRGTRSYQIEKFSGMPVLTSNWRFASNQQRAYTRCIPIPFCEHTDEPDATKHYTKLDQARQRVARSVAKIINICTTFGSATEERKRNNDIFPQVSQIFCNSHVRFKTTFTAFTYFFLEVCGV